MGTTYQEFTEKLGKLQRNETQMSERQRVIYAAQLKALRQTVADLASKMAKDFTISGIRLLTLDAPESRECISRVQAIIDQEVKAGAMKKASRVLFTTYDKDKFLEALLPIRHRVWYEGYGPYWCQHCRETSPDEAVELEKNGCEGYTHYSDIIGAWYHGEWKVWIFPDGKSFTAMLPPTMEMVQGEYEKEKQNS